MSENTVKCIVCDATNQNLPLIKFEFQDKGYHICSQHLPILIHKPAQLADKLVGIDPSGAEHAH